jgi:tRNA-dihydrouridine synthase B
MSRFPLPPNALLLAPMVGLSHRAFRELVASFGGCDLYYTEMTSSSGFISGSPYDRYFLDTLPAPSQTVLQFYATDIPRMVEAARAAQSIPAAGLDLNFGCSAPHIEKHGGGVSWMKDSQSAHDLVVAVREVWQEKSLSVKMRIGYDDDYSRLRDFCGALVEAGVDYIVLHPRLKNEKLRRLGRWEYVRALGEDLPVPVIGNGDVRSFEVWDERVRTCHPAGVMLGREAVRRPWIFALLRGRQTDPGFSMTVDIAGTAEKGLSLIEEYLPREFYLTRARRFFFYYCDNFTFAHHVRWKIQNAPDLAAIRAILAEYFAQVPGDSVKTER